MLCEAKQRKPWVNCKFGIVAFKQKIEFNLNESIYRESQFNCKWFELRSHIIIR